MIKIVKNIREYIISKGGQILFGKQLTDLEIENGKIKAVIYNKTYTNFEKTNNLSKKTEERIETDSVILAIGHSARDTFKKLYEIGVEMQPKNFAIGDK